MNKILVVGLLLSIFSFISCVKVPEMTIAEIESFTQKSDSELIKNSVSKPWKGENFVNGDQALSFARERYAFAEGDRQRGRNQMAVIKGVINKMTESNVLKNVYTVLSEIEGDYQTDIPFMKIISLAPEVL